MVKSSDLDQNIIAELAFHRLGNGGFHYGSRGQEPVFFFSVQTAGSAGPAVLLAANPDAILKAACAALSNEGAAVSLRLSWQQLSRVVPDCIAVLQGVPSCIHSLVLKDMPGSIAVTAKIALVLDRQGFSPIDEQRGASSRATFTRQDANTRHLRKPNTNFSFSEIAIVDGNVNGVAIARDMTPDAPTILLSVGGSPQAVCRSTSAGGGTRFEFTLELPMHALFSGRTESMELYAAGLESLSEPYPLTLPDDRQVSAERLLDVAAASASTVQRRRKPFGIIVFGHTRADGLKAILRALDMQEALPLVTVWLDGDQGKPEAKRLLDDLALELGAMPLGAVKRQRGNLGFRKTAIHGLMHMIAEYDQFLVLEDDCFPTRDAVQVIREALDAHSSNETVVTVYGHHFGVPHEWPLSSRFQGWGWATYSDRISPLISELAYLYSLPEHAYVEWVERMLTPDILLKIDTTPPRLTSITVRSFFAWDETLCLLAAIHNRWHAPTSVRCIYNFGVGADSTHFRQPDWYRQPPYNMVPYEEIWNHFGEA